MYRKGIVLAGGLGNRLFPLSKVVSKQILPVYDKPMIYYPLSTLMLAGIRDILIISSRDHSKLFQDLLGTGSQYGLNLTYITQKKPKGLADAYIIAEKYLNGNPSALILGDNIFYGNQLIDILKQANTKTKGACIFLQKVKNPQSYGVASFSKKNKIIDIIEKPKKPKSNFAVTGLYFFDETACKKAKLLKPSRRGELEITDLNKLYLNEKKLLVRELGRGIAWLDAGTYTDMMSASNFVANIENRQQIKIACLEEIAYRQNFINKSTLLRHTNKMPECEYKKYVLQILDEEKLN